MCEVRPSICMQGEVVKFFVVDCRPVEHFSSGHLPGSYNLDANLVCYHLLCHYCTCNRQIAKCVLLHTVLCHSVALNTDTAFTLSLPISLSLFSFFTLQMISQWRRTDCVPVSRRRGQTRGSTCVSWALGGNKRTSMSTWWWPSSYRKPSPMSVWLGAGS